MKAPDFSLPDQNGEIHNLKDYKGKYLIVYFYPKDDTPGCTTEACSFRDNSVEFSRLGVGIVGISKDTVKSHKKFESKYKLNFPILSDPDNKIIDAYGAWGRKKLFGREYDGIHRNTYIINPEGEIVKKYENVNPLTHTKKILEDLSDLIANL